LQGDIEAVKRSI